MRVVGDITRDGVVKIEGTVVGTVRAGRQVLVAKGGEVEGDVIAREAIIGGEVRGTVVAQERAEIQSSSVIHGDVTCKRLLVQAKAGRSTASSAWARPSTAARTMPRRPPRSRRSRAPVADYPHNPVSSMWIL